MPVPLSVLAFVPGIADTPFGAEVSTDLCLRDTGESYACKELPVTWWWDTASGSHSIRKGPQKPPDPVCLLCRSSQRGKVTGPSHTADGL